MLSVLKYNKADKGQFMPLRFVLSASGFLYKILSTSVQHKEEREKALSLLTENETLQ